MLSDKLKAISPSANAASIVVTYSPSSGAVGSGGSITFTAIDIGTPTSNRIVALYFGGGANSAGNVTAVTIGGISATLAVEYSPTSTRHGSIWYATVSSGSTADINVSFSNSFNFGAYLFVTAIYNTVSSTPITGVDFTTSTGVSPTRSVTLTPSANSVLLAGYTAGGIAAGTTSTWTNATEQGDNVTGLNIYTAATDTGLANVSRTISVTNTDSSVNQPGLVVATWA